MREAALLTIRAALGFVAAWLLFEGLAGVWVSALAAVLDAGAVPLSPPGRSVMSVASDGTFLWLDHAPRVDGAPGGLGRLPEAAFFYLDAGSFAGRTFLAAAALFAAAAVGGAARSAVRFLVLVVALFLLDLLSFASLVRFGYDTSKDLYDTAGVFLLGPWARFALPLALAWIAARPRAGGAAANTAPLVGPEGM